MPCSWEGNRRSGVALAMRHRHSGSPPTGSMPGRGRWASPYTLLWSMVDFTFTLCLPCCCESHESVRTEELGKLDRQMKAKWETVIWLLHLLCKIKGIIVLSTNTVCHTLAAVHFLMRTFRNIFHVRIGKRYLCLWHSQRSRMVVWGC